MADLSGASTLGPQPAPIELGKSLKSRHVAMISIGGIIGAGLFVGSSASIASVGPAIVLSYLIAGAVVLGVMRMLGEMAVAIPGKGFVDYIRIGLGDWAGFVSGWLYWYFWVIVVAVEAIAGATLLHNWIDIPGMSDNVQIAAIGLALLLALTGVNLLSARSYGEFEFWFASIKVAAILVFIAIAGAYALGIGSPTGPTFENLYIHRGFAPFGWTAVLAGVVSAFFALGGGEIATIAAAESAEPARNVAKMTTSIVLRILLFYVGSVFLIVTILPWTSVTPGQSPFAAALALMKIPGAATIMNLIVITAVLSCLNSGLYVTSRVLFTLADSGHAPKAMVALNRRRAPARAVLLGSLFGYGAILVSVISPRLVFTFLLNASGAIIIFVYLLAALAQIRLRPRLERDDPEALKLKMWLFPWLSYAVVAGILAVLIAMALTPSLASQLWVSLLSLAVVAGAYLAVRGRRGARPAT